MLSRELLNHIRTIRILLILMHSKHIKKKGAELEAEYKLAVQEIEKLYIPETIKKHKYNWMLPNNSTKLEISIMCNCEIEGVENEKN